VRPKPLVALVSAVMSLVSLSCGVAAPNGLDLARAEARQRGVPLLLDFYTDW
jgi:hypothetical protein